MYLIQTSTPLFLRSQFVRYLTAHYKVAISIHVRYLHKVPWETWKWQKSHSTLQCLLTWLKSSLIETGKNIIIEPGRLLALKPCNYNPVPEVKRKNRELKQQMSGVKKCDRKGGPKDTGSKNHSNKRATECLEGAVTWAKVTLKNKIMLFIFAVIKQQK